MNLKNIVELLKEGKKLEELINITHTHIPLILQRQIIKNVVSFSVTQDEETGFMKNDLIIQELMTVLNIVLESTDVDIEGLIDEEGNIKFDIALESYDEIIKHGIYAYVQENVKTNVLYLIDLEIQQTLEIYNSTANVLSQTIKNISDKIPNQETIMSMMSTIPQQISDIQNLQILNPKKSTKRSKKSDGQITM